MNGFLNGVSVSFYQHNECSGCGGCGLTAGKPANRLHIVLTRGNASFSTDICTAAGEEPPTPKMLARHMGFLAKLPTDPDALRSDRGFLKPSMAYAAAAQSAALRKFLTPAELSYVGVRSEEVRAQDIGSALAEASPCLSGPNREEQLRTKIRSVA
jgi:hypothetical protein